jgi:hypothetical protein
MYQSEDEAEAEARDGTTPPSTPARDPNQEDPPATPATRGPPEPEIVPPLMPSASLDSETSSFADPTAPDYRPPAAATATTRPPAAAKATTTRYSGRNKVLRQRGLATSAPENPFAVLAKLPSPVLKQESLSGPLSLGASARAQPNTREHQHHPDAVLPDGVLVGNAPLQATLFPGPLSLGVAAQPNTREPQNPPAISGSRTSLQGPVDQRIHGTGAAMESSNPLFQATVGLRSEEPGQLSGYGFTGDQIQVPPLAHNLAAPFLEPVGDSVHVPVPLMTGTRQAIASTGSVQSRPADSGLPGGPGPTPITTVLPAS